MTEQSYEWRALQANDGKARSFELWNLGTFRVVLSVRAKAPMTIDEMRRLMSLAKG
jgi:hypothetical protein